MSKPTNKSEDKAPEEVHVVVSGGGVSNSQVAGVFQC